jgi:hypothetical protein
MLANGVVSTASALRRKRIEGGVVDIGEVGFSALEDASMDSARAILYGRDSKTFGMGHTCR